MKSNKLEEQKKVFKTVKTTRLAEENVEFIHKNITEIGETT